MDDRKDSAVRYLHDDLERRRKYSRGPRKMGDVVSRLMSRRGYAQVQTVNQCVDAWRTAVGGSLARQSHAGVVRRGVLQVTVRNSTVMQELSFQKKRLLKELARLAPDQQISNLRFRVGPIPKD